jgi:hypothetical protein
MCICWRSFGFSLKFGFGPQLVCTIKIEHIKQNLNSVFDQQRKTIICWFADGSL